MGKKISFLNTQDRLIKPFLDISSFNGNNHLYVIHISNQKDHNAAQLNSVDLELCDTGGVIDVLNYIIFALVLPNRLVTFYSDGRRMYDLI